MLEFRTTHLDSPRTDAHIRLKCEEGEGVGVGVGVGVGEGHGVGTQRTASAAFASTPVRLVEERIRYVTTGSAQQPRAPESGAGAGTAAAHKAEEKAQEQRQPQTKEAKLTERVQGE